MKELGEYLRDSRKNHGVSIEEAALDLQIDSNELVNIENGNTRAFKDVYALRELVKNYAKYLGLDSNKVLDEFNDFLFEHTSKISLDDILEARKRNMELDKKKVTSPYTKIKKKKVNLAPIVLLILAIILFILILFLLFRHHTGNKPINSELRSDRQSREVIYERTE